MVDSQSQTKQGQVTIELKSSNVDSIRCFNERVGGLLSGTRNRGSMVKPGSKETYQCTPIESRKFCHIDI